jgi:small conductance mechanosensitive channel
MTLGQSTSLPTDILEQIRHLFDPATLPGAALIAVIIAVAAWLTGRMIYFAVQRILNQPKHIPSDPMAIRFMGQLARAGVYVFAVVTYARIIPQLDKFGTALLASAAIVSVVFGMAAQNTLGNLIAGISLLLYRPFNIGDRVQVTAPTGLETGVVESLNLGYTVLRTIDDRHVVIPNSVMASQASINLSSSGSRALCTVPFNLSPDTDVERTRKILTEIAAKYSKAGEYAGSPITALSGAGFTVTLKVWCDDYAAATDLKNRLMEAARERFKAEGIKLQ